MSSKNNIFLLDHLKELAKKQGAVPCISLYMPTHRSGRDAQEDPLRFKNLIKKAVKDCSEQGVGADEIKRILKPHEQLLEDPVFWQNQSDGLAVFAAPGVFEWFRLPIKFKELAAAGEVFIFKPLFFYLGEYGKFYLLQLTKNRVKLYQGSVDGIAEIDCLGLPKNLEEALWYKDYEKQLQSHSSGGQRGKALIFHGHGVGHDDLKFRIRRYLRHIDNGIIKCLRDRSIPLVVAGVEYFMPIFREVSKYPLIMEEILPGNTEKINEEDLRARAWKTVQKYYDRLKAEEIKKCADILETSKASYLPDYIVKKAWEGKVAEIFAPFGRQIWGKFDRNSGWSELHDRQKSGDIDILSLAVFFTYLHNGKVYVVDPEEMPLKKEIAAILRK